MNTPSNKVPRFIETTAEAIGEEVSEFYQTKWWLDTARPINHEQKFVAIETEVDKDPNNFIKIEGKMRILYNDQAEYYFVCQPCYSIHSHQQFSGSTRSGRNWREEAEKELAEHAGKKGWCEFCDPIFGNGGWSLD